MTLRSFHLLFCFVAIYSGLLHAQRRSDSSRKNGAAEEKDSQNVKQNSELLEKLTLADGQSAVVGVLNTVNNTSQDYGDLFEGAVGSSLVQYGKVRLRQVNESLESLTLVDIRTVVVRSKVDVLLIPLVKARSLTLFLFDRRTPRVIFTAAEELPDDSQEPIGQESIYRYCKSAVRRLLYSYLKGQSIALARDSLGSRLLASDAEVASNVGTFSAFNREITSSKYISLMAGAALNLDPLHQLQNSNLLDAEFGIRLFDSYFFETAIDIFSYNCLGTSIQYLSDPKKSLLRYSLGGGLAMGFYSHTIADNPNVPYGTTVGYVTADSSLMYSVGDVLLKLEGKAFLGFGASKMAFLFLTGLMIPM